MAETPEVLSAALPTVPPSGRSILVLEDDRATRLVVATLLRRQGHHVLEAGRIKEAMTQLETGRVDLIVVDGLLPDGTGVDFIRALRDRGHQAAIVFVSSFFKDKQSYESLSKGLGVAAVVQKPFEPEKLISSVQQILSSR